MVPTPASRARTRASPREDGSPSARDVGARPGDADLPAADAGLGLPDATAPSADATAPPADATAPPADATVPPTDATAPPADATAPEPPPSIDALRLTGSSIGNLFTSAQLQGVCYRIPSVIRAGEFIAVLAAKRRGHSPDAPRGATPRRPVRLTKDKLQNATACGDEGFISVAMRLARVERDPRTGALLPPDRLRWSPEIVVVDIERYVERALNPGSRFFEPAMYDYYLRLRDNRFRYGFAGYLACTSQRDCAHLERCAAGTEQGEADDNACQALRGRNMFQRYMEDEYPEVADLGDWLAVDGNARMLVNARFGSQAATGIVDAEGRERLALTGILAYPTVPHAAHNAYLEGDTVMKHAAVRVDLRALWETYGAAPPDQSVSLSLGDPAVEWKLGFESAAGAACLDRTQAWLDRAEGRRAVADFDEALARADLPVRSLAGPSGLDLEVAPPASAAEILDLVRWFGRVQDPMAAVAALGPEEDLAPVLDERAWVEALRTAYLDEPFYPDLIRAAGTRERVLAELGAADQLTRRRLTDLHALVGVPMAKGSAVEREERALAAVMSVYARLLNVRVNQFARRLHGDDALGESPVGERLSRLLFKSARFGPGNGLFLPRAGRVFLPIAGGFPLSLDETLNDVDCEYDDLSIRRGSERQVAILGREGDDYRLFMTLRYAGVQSAGLVGGVPQPFDLATWTRDLSVSFDSGRSWVGDSVLPPTHLQCAAEAPARGTFHRVEACVAEGAGADAALRVTPETPGRPGRAFVVEATPDRGFLSSQVQASVTSIPGFFGRTVPLVLHVHPSTATRAIIERPDGAGSEVVSCLGEAPGDASQADGSRCDFRFNLRVTPGLPNAPAEGERPPDGARAVDWRFDRGLTVHPGSAGYSAAVFLGRESCSEASIAVAYEGTPRADQYEYRGFNNGVQVQFVRAAGGDYSHLGACAGDLDTPIDF